MPGMSAGHQANMFQFSRRNSISALSYAGGKLVETRAIFLESVGWTWCALVSLVALRDDPGVDLLPLGKRVRSLVSDS